MNAIRLVATDIDGTLLDSTGHVSARTRAALDAAVEAGLLVAFVTGRPPRWLDDLVDETGHHGVAVGANGAVLYDMAREEVLLAHTLDRELTVALALALRAEFPEVSFAVETARGFAAEPGYVHDWDINPKLDRRGAPIPPPRIGELAEIVDEPVVKLLAKDRAADPDTFLAAAGKLVGDRATPTHSSSFGLLEMSAPGRHQGHRPGRARGAPRRPAPTRSSRSATCPTTSRCCCGPAGPTPWPTPTPTSGPPPTRSTRSNDDDAVAVVIESLL